MAIPKNVEPVASGPKRSNRGKKEFIGEKEEYWIMRQFLDNAENEELPECTGLEVGSRVYFDPTDFYQLLGKDADWETKPKWAHLGRAAKAQTWFTVSKVADLRGFMIANEELAIQRMNEMEDKYVLTANGDVESS